MDSLPEPVYKTMPVLKSNDKTDNNVNEKREKRNKYINNWYHKNFLNMYFDPKK